MKKDFIAISDYSPEELQSILDLAVRLKQERASGEIVLFSTERHWP